MMLLYNASFSSFFFSGQKCWALGWQIHTQQTQIVVLCCLYIYKSHPNNQHSFFLLVPLECGDYLVLIQDNHWVLYPSFSSSSSPSYSISYQHLPEIIFKQNQFNKKLIYIIHIWELSHYSMYRYNR